MKFLLAKKLQMSQVFDDSGIVYPVTAVSVYDAKVSKIKTVDTDGYEAVQVEYLGKKKKEFRGEAKDMSIGDEVDINSFSAGDVVKVSSISKGKGFAGVVKRHGFAGGPASHGHKKRLRKPGSIGVISLARVAKGKKMAGRMGGERVSIKGSTVVSVDKDRGVILLKGSIPGRRGSLVEIKSI